MSMLDEPSRTHSAISLPDRPEGEPHHVRARSQRTSLDAARLRPPPVESPADMASDRPTPNVQNWSEELKRIALTKSPPPASPFRDALRRLLPCGRLP